MGFGYETGIELQLDVDFELELESVVKLAGSLKVLMLPATC